MEGGRLRPEETIKKLRTAEAALAGGKKDFLKRLKELERKIPVWRGW